MPARDHVLLTDAERAALFGIPVDPDELARRYTLEAADLDLINQRRHDRNRLGMALQVALLRHPGLPLAQVLQIEGAAPTPLVAFLARQLGLSPAVLADYASRTQTMTDHARIVAEATGVRPPTRGDIATMIAAAEQAASGTDAGLPIATGIVDALRSANILLPMPSTIERAGIAGRSRARKNASHMMVAGLPASADTWIEERAAVLDDRLKRFAHNVTRGRLEGVKLVDGRLQITPVRTQPSPPAEELADTIGALMPRIRITELLHDVANETGFLAGFTNLRTGRQSDNGNALLAAILADATNLGLARMAAASQGVTRDQLVWTKDAYVREDSYKRALAILIDAQHRLPIASVWGDGTTSSSDGQFFRGGKRLGVGDINARYGVDPGFSLYTECITIRGQPAPPSPSPPGLCDGGGRAGSRRAPRPAATPWASRRATAHEGERDRRGRSRPRSRAVQSRDPLPLGRAFRVGFGDIGVKRGLGDAHQPADLAHGLVLRAVELDRVPALLRREPMFAPAHAAPRACGLQPRFGPLAHQSALELGQGGEQVKGQLAVDRGSVDAFRHRAELHARLVQPAHQRDQVGQRPAEPVEAPHHELVARARILERRGQARPICLGA